MRCGGRYHSTRLVSKLARIEAQHGIGKLTIAIDGTVGAGLFAIALDLLPPTFVAGAGYSPPLLEWLWLWRLAVVEVVARGMVVAGFRAILV